MTPGELVERASADGLEIELTPDGTVKVRGNPGAGDRWMPELRARKAEILAALQASADEATHWLWRIRYMERPPMECAIVPAVTHDRILELHPGAVAAEPFEPIIRQPSAPLTAREEAAIRRWLESIGEHDPVQISAVLDSCRADRKARDYYLRRAAGLDE